MSEGNIVNRLDDLCKNKIVSEVKKSTHNNAAQLLTNQIFNQNNQEFLYNIDAFNDITNRIQNRGRHADICHNLNTSLLSCTCLNEKEHISRKTRSMNILYNIEGIRDYKSEKCIVLRLDDMNMPDFWMELNIPIKDIQYAISNDDNNDIDSDDNNDIDSDNNININNNN
jgi:hypothetical protein